MAPPSSRRGRRRQVGVSVLVVGVLLASIALLLSLRYLIGFMDPEVPPASAVPELPDGLSVVAEREHCGSRSCARELLINGPPGTSANMVVARLDRPQATCRPNGWLDSRPLCVGVNRYGDEVWLYVSLSERTG